jgi:hypothetical protein
MELEEREKLLEEELEKQKLSAEEDEEKEFNEEEWMDAWVEKNPEIIVPEDCDYDVDADCVLEDEPDA